MFRKRRGLTPARGRAVRRPADPRDTLAPTPSGPRRAPPPNVGTSYPSPRDALKDGIGNKSHRSKKIAATLRSAIFPFSTAGILPFWPRGVDNLTIDNMKIDTNRDGLDIDCCRNVRVSNCSVNSPWDDGIFALRPVMGWDFFVPRKMSRLPIALLPAGSTKASSARRDLCALGARAMALHCWAYQVFWHGIQWRL